MVFQPFKAVIIHAETVTKRAKIVFIIDHRVRVI